MIATIVAFIVALFAKRRVLHGDRKHRAAVEVGGVLGLVRQVRAAVLHLGDLRIGIVRILPVVVRSLARTLLVDLCQVSMRQRLDPRRFASAVRESSYFVPSSRRTMLRSAALASRVVALIPIASPFQEALLGQHLEHECENLLLDGPDDREVEVLRSQPTDYF